MMKKVLIALLMVAMVFTFAACNNGGEDDLVVDDPGVVDDGDEQSTGDLSQEMLDSLKDMDERLGIIFALPADYSDIVYSVINDNIAQAEFKIDGRAAFARIAKGEYKDLSSNNGVSFDITETVKVKGLDVRLRYSDPDVHAVTSANRIGVADAYDATNDVSYNLVIFTDATKDELTDVMETIIETSSLGEPGTLYEEPANAEDEDANPNNSTAE